MRTLLWLFLIAAFVPLPSAFGQVTVSPTVYVDAPAQGATVSGIVMISGWAVDNASEVGTAISTVQVMVDGTLVGTATYGSSRPDVCAAYPGRPGCPNVGYSFSLNTSTLSVGTHTITVTATDSDTTPDTGSSSVTVNVPIPPAVWIDTPASGAAASGTVTVSGWAVDNASEVGTAISTVQVMVDGTLVGTATYGSSRPDVCAAYPGRPGCPNVGYSFSLNTSTLSVGTHTITVTATDSDTTPDTGSSSVTVNVPIPPTVWIDTPASGAAASGTVTVSGWAVDNASEVGTAISTVQVMVDGTLVGTATYGSSRPDVCAAYPGRPGCPNVGYSFSLNTSTLSVGTHTITVTATDSDTTPDTGSSSVTVNVPIPPTVWIDTPASGAAASGTVTVSGWAVDNASEVGTAISTVQVMVDGTLVGTATYGSSRPDVCAAYPGRPGCPNVGYSFSLNTSTLSVGTHTITVTATDSDTTPDTGSSSVTVNVPIPPAVWIDTPASGAAASGTVTVSGWAVDNASEVGTAISTVQVMVDGTLVGTATYGSSRPDVCAAYPGRPGCPNVGYSFSLNTSTLSVGTHTITVTATDSDTTPDTGSSSVTVNVPIPPAVWIDTPASGAAASGTVTVSGWAVDNASEVGTAISTVQVMVDGTLVGTATYGSSRPDVCAAYPGRPGCPNVGYSFSLNTSTLSVGTHTITVTATDSDTTPDTGSSSVTVTTSPNITSLSPTAGPVGTSITINGTNFEPPVSGTGLETDQGAGTIIFSGTVATPISWSGTSIVVQVPEGATTGNVMVTVGGQTSNSVGFTVIPNIMSLSQPSGPAATWVTVAGESFGTTQGASTITFNGVVATPVIWSDETIVAPVPTGATTGNVVVTVGGESSNGLNFTVTASSPPATYYIDFVSGSDQNNGTSKDSPWRYAPGMSGCSANCGSIALNPGDSIIFKGGVTWDCTGFPMSVLRSGSSVAPIYYGVDKTWFAGAAWTRPVFDLGNSLSLLVPVLTNSVSFVTFDNLEIKNQRVDALNPGIPRGGITVYGGANVTIENCYIHSWSIQDPIEGSDGTFGGIAFYNNSVGGVVQNCTLDGSPASNSGTAIYGGTTIQGNIVENVPNGILVFDPAAVVSGNQVFNVTDSVDVSALENGVLVSGGGQIYNNLVHDIATDASAIYLQSAERGAGNTQYVYNNLIWNVGSYAPVVIDPGNMTANLQSNQSIFNNTLNGGSGACISVLGDQIAPTNLTVENNHCISDETSLPAWCWNDADGNIACGTVINPTFTNNVLMSTAQAQSQGYTIADSFEPTTLSSATVGAGLNLSAQCVLIGSSLCSDRLGVGRPGGVAIWDAGAYLYQASQNLSPSITVEPASQTVQLGQAATFTVVAAGGAPLSYQWQENGVNLPGATSSSYTTGATTGADSGSTFDVIVTNTTASVTSTRAILAVNVPPTITAQPLNQTVVAGETATFKVAASGPGELNYQWLENGVRLFAPFGGRHSSYTTPPTTFADSGEQFAVIVTDAIGNITSNAAILTVVAPASPATYYVDFASGSDQNSGVSKDSPWQYAPGMSGCSANCRSITPNPGDSILFKGGVTWDSTGFPMSVLRSGSSAAPIYYGVDKTWFAGAAWTRPVFDLIGAITLLPPVLADSVSFVTFDNLEIKNEQSDALNPGILRGSITVYGGSNVTIENCYVHGWSIHDPIPGSDENPFGGIAFYSNSVGGVVTNCTFDGAPASNSGTAIYGGTTIQGNVIENVPNGIVVFDPAAVVSGNQVFNVTDSVDSSVVGNGILVFGGGQIYNNVMHDIVADASVIYLQSAGQGAGNTQYVYNNLIWNAGSNSPVVIDPGNMTANLQSNQFIFNNTLNGGSGACISVLGGQVFPTNLTVENNHCISDQTNQPAWCWNSANANAGCGIVINPTFTDNVLMSTAQAQSQGYTIANSFEPTSLSSATVGAGLNLTAQCVPPNGSSLCSDRLGVGRPGGSAMWDAGAYLYQTSQSLAPLITVQPASQTVQVGQAATFTVVAAGSVPLSYQWQENGVNIPGATSMSYTTAATTGADSGSTFDVIVTNTNASTTSTAAILTLNTGNGLLSASPASLNFGNVAVGSNSGLSVTVTNSSASTITILNVSISGPGFGTEGSPNGLILGSGESTTFYVTFSPTTAGGTVGALTITSTASNSSLPIVLSGSGVQPTSHFITLSWRGSTSSVLGYYVYRSSQAGGPYVLLNSTPAAETEYSDFSVISGQMYFYVVSAVDSSNVQSRYSNEVSTTVP